MYAHTVRITRPGARGTYSETDAEYDPAEDDVLYDGSADVQDLPRDEVRDREGKPDIQYEAKVYFPLGAATDTLFSPQGFNLKHQLLLHSTSPLGNVREGRIREVHDLDQSITVRWARDVA